MSYRIVVGDATKPQTDASNIIIAHCCNDENRWGSGFVLALNKTFGTGPENAYHQWYQQPCDDKFHLGNTQFVEVCGENNRHIFVANMIGQHGTGCDEKGNPPIRYDALTSAMAKVRDNAILLKAELHCPWFGCERAGGSRPVIEALVKNIWVQRGLTVTMYDFAAPANPCTEIDL